MASRCISTCCQDRSIQAPSPIILPIGSLPSEVGKIRTSNVSVLYSYLTKANLILLLLHPNRVALGCAQTCTASLRSVQMRC